MSSIALKRRIQRDLHGLQFERDALTCLVDFIELQDNHDEAIDRFVESLEKSEPDCCGVTPRQCLNTGSVL